MKVIWKSNIVTSQYCQVKVCLKPMISHSKTSQYSKVKVCLKSLISQGKTSQYHKVIVYLKPVISQSKFSGSRKFTLRYQQFEIKEVEMHGQMGNVFKLHSLIQENTLRYRCSRYQELTVSTV